MTHICVGEIIIIGSDYGLSPGRRQAIIWTNAGILLIGPLRMNFSDILIEINTFSFNKMHLKMSSAKWRLFRLGLNVLTGLLTATLPAHISSSSLLSWQQNGPLNDMIAIQVLFTYTWACFSCDNSVAITKRCNTEMKHGWRCKITHMWEMIV